MYKKIFLAFLTSCTLTLAACGNDEAEGKPANSTDIDSEGSSTEKKETEETESSLNALEYTMENISSSSFIFSNYGRTNNNTKVARENETEEYEEYTKYDDVLIEDSYQELVGLFNNELSGFWYLLTREKNSNYSYGVNGLSFITDLSPEDEVTTELIKKWNSDGYTFKLHKAFSEYGGKIVRLDYLTSSTPSDNEDEDNINTYDTIYIEGTPLENNEKLQGEIGDFDLNKLYNVSLIDEPLEIENNTTKATILSMTYSVGDATGIPFIDMEIEYIPKEDGPVDIEMFFPYSNTEDKDDYYFYEEVYKGIPLKSTYTLFDVPFLFLEEKIIFTFNEESYVIDFEKEGFKFSNSVNYEDDSLAGVESVDYYISYVEGVSDKDTVFEVTYDEFESEINSNNYTTKEWSGTIPAVEGATSVNIYPALEYTSYDEGIELIKGINLEKPLITSKLTLNVEDAE